MDDIYLIEIRLAMTKWRIRETISFVGRLLGLEGFLETSSTYHVAWTLITQNQDKSAI